MTGAGFSRPVTERQAFNCMFGIILAVLIFSAIVLFHEFGHFLLAKRGGITVVEFSLGMGPRLFSLEKGGTRYSLKAFPFGGSCMMLGEDEEEQGEGSFGSKSVWTRISVVAAGPVFNFILAYVMAVVVYALAGVDLPQILDVSEGYPAQMAGIEAGDTITEIDGKKISLYREISDYVTFHQDKLMKQEPISVSWIHDGEKKSASIVPADNGEGRYILGIVGSSSYRTRLSLPKTLLYGANEVKYWINVTFMSLGMLFTGQASVNDLSGPVGVVEVIGDTYQQSRPDGAYYVFLNMLNIAILLSANLGVMNLLPIPALDGGRLLFMLLEVLRGKRINPEIEARIHLAGIMLLLALMVFVMFNDVHKIFF